MYKYISRQIRMPDDFFLPFGGKLDPNNRWVKLAYIIPWEGFEEEYAKNFKKSNTGEQAYNVRVALGTLIIKERLGLSDEETVNQISENPYLQYFLGFEKFALKTPFNPSQLTHFRKRFPADMLNRVNEAIIRDEKNEDDSDKGASAGGENEKVDASENSGTLILDATCTPADIQYPTDIRLLNDARELLEEIVDGLHSVDKGKEKRPRTYREKARKEYIAFSKKRKPKPKEIKKMKSKLLRYIRRLLRYVEKLSVRNGLEMISKRQYRGLLVVSEFYRQQMEMLNKKQYRIEDRIVSLSQPHVRPIVRGKVSAATEFGAKVGISIEEGFARCEIISWDAFNEGTTLVEAVERYRERNGFYPQAILADKIYRNRENRNFCKENNIRLSGPGLGKRSEEVKKEEQKQAYQDSCDRNQIEGKFGEGKRKYSLGKIMTKLAETSMSSIVISFIVMNLEKRLRLLLCALTKWAELWIINNNFITICVYC